MYRGSTTFIYRGKYTVDKQVDEHIAKQNSPQREICQELRQLIFGIYPDIEEVMKWGVPTYGNGKYYIVALKDHVNLGFSLKDLTPETLALFDGTGTTMRHIKISRPKDIDKKQITKLLKLIK